MTASHPYASSYRDRHGHARWRFRRGKKVIALPGQPGEPRFEDAYQAAVEGRPVTKPALVRPHPGAIVPRSLRDAWRIHVSTTEWKALRLSSKQQQRAVAERFLTGRVDPAQPTIWADVLLEHLQRRHVKAILAARSATPHAARHVLSLLRKLTLVALDESWIAADPTHRVKHRPEFKGQRAWTDAERETFEARWPLGTTARTAYALALYTGSRRGDVREMRWADIDGDVVRIVQGKTKRALVLPVLPALRQALDAAERRGATILAKSNGDPYSAKTLSESVREWRRAAGLPNDCTLHGLRRTLGKTLAEGGATTRQIMDVLGHTSIQHAELYSREAEQQRLARAGMGKVKAALRPRLKAIRRDGEP